MRHFIKQFSLLAFVLFSKTNSFGQTKFLLDNQFKDYIPISAIEFESPIIIADSIGSFDTLSTKELSTNRLKLQKFLNDYSVYVTIEKADTSGKIEYAVASASVEKGSYTVVVDFVKYNTVSLILNDNTCGGFGKVGVGMRLRANVETKKSGLNIGNLFGLALAAQKEKITGTLTFEIIGIDSKDIINLIPLPSEISTSSIANALQAMATIKSKLDDPETRLHPKLVSIKLTGSGQCGIDGLIKQVDSEGKSKHQLRQQQLQLRNKEEEEN